MKRMAISVLAAVLLLSIMVPCSTLSAASDDYETLEFFLDQSLKSTEDSGKKIEIVNRYNIKALGLIYKQNKQLILLQRQILNTLKQLQEIEYKEKRDRELQMHRR